MDELVVLEEQVKAQYETDHGEKLRVYRWRPNGLPQLPACWNQMVPSTFEPTAVGRWTDTVRIAARVGVRHTDPSAEQQRIEWLTDTFREIVDPALAPTVDPIGGVRKAERVSMGLALDEFNGVDLLCMEFIIQATLDRIIP